ncbi:hypothetical protein EXIGLDRAFT_663273 [Exidia glandulosa HHB12029]|uniref:Uncharacterized protein n=1 Tax=Exidia glandulosa HHB12029 TaxID=1314781 RepID=A0A165QPT1_EXIGL|nr:hypothetical protein EXIGLDRAFT_663273 [Exidia glandulosa HHB12029]
MVDWMSPEEIARDADAFSKLMFALFGLYVWEMLTTMRFELSILNGSKRFQWPLVFYFLLRYSLFFALLGLIITLSVRTQIDCQTLYTFIQWAGNTSIATASLCLMLRTIAVWERKLIVVLPLVALHLGQWAILLHSVVSVRATWVPAANTCVVTGNSPTMLNIVYFYTMSFDFVILCTTCMGLLMSSSRSSLWQLLFRDGIVYFLVTFCSNLVPATLNLLNLNPVMNVITAVPAATVSTIAATRLVVRLQESSSPVYIHSSAGRIESIGHWRRPFFKPTVTADAEPEGVRISTLTQTRYDSGNSLEAGKLEMA